jgi:hypothetical protein
MLVTMDTSSSGTESWILFGPVPGDVSIVLSWMWCGSWEKFTGPLSAPGCLTPPLHHQNAQMRPEGYNDMQEHEYGWWHKGSTRGDHSWLCLNDMAAIAVKMGWGKIEDVVIRQGSLVVATVIHISELNNLILVCIREGSHIISSTVSNLKGMIWNCNESVYCVGVVGFSSWIKESLMNNIILLEKENAFKWPPYYCIHHLYTMVLVTVKFWLVTCNISAQFADMAMVTHEEETESVTFNDYVNKLPEHTKWLLMHDKFTPGGECILKASSGSTK